ncbi:hypothetical protein [Pedobacter sp.]|uniref:hypothetical protein n=1 Tax=Pedobacter sp. TaxID=1411316 RepID=UPI003BAC56DF
MRIENINPWLLNIIVIILISVISYYSNPKMKSLKEVSGMKTGKRTFNSNMGISYNYFNANIKQNQVAKKQDFYAIFTCW